MPRAVTAPRRRARGADARKRSAAPVPMQAEREVDETLRRCACGGSCPGCRADALRPKLAINTPGDAFEREADRAADAVMSASPAATPSPAPPALRRCACGGSCPSCRKEKEKEKQEELHREEAGGGGAPGFAPPVVHDVLASPGRPLEAPARGFMEARFGADFSGVRVHDDARAAESARAVSAHAYTVGRDVVFGAGRYAPGTPAGDRLLAHELAHTLQGGGAALRRQPVDGSFLGGGTGDPQSLTGSISLPSASPQAIRNEIAAIRRWLLTHPVTDPNAERLHSELGRLEAHLNPVPLQTTVWDAFAPLFNQEFAGVLPVAGAPGAPLTPTQLAVLFTDKQRQKLTEFITTRRIPEHLFNGGEKGKTTAQQRLLLSAHILANGVYKPGSFDQRVHAQFCFHWVQIVHHYAGATPPGAGFAGGVMGSFDPLGSAVLTTGRLAKGWHETYVQKPDLPGEETPGGTGPLHPGTKHEEAARKAEETDPAKAKSFHRQPSLPIERFHEVQAGDWLWYYNGNASGGGGHSVIFSHWEGATVTRKEDGARYRVAVVWSQPSSARGGVRHRARLGERFVPNPANNMDPFVVPITHITRVTPETAPATTVAELLPGPEGKAATALANANDAFIKAKEKKLKGVVDRAKLKEWLRERNRGFLMVLGTHLSKEQAKLVKDANRGDDLEALVRLFQRLRPLSGYALTLDANLASAYATLNVKHAEARAKAEAARVAAVKDIGAADAELQAVAADTAAREKRRAELDVDPRIRQLQKDAADLLPKIARAKPGPDREVLDRKRQELLAQVALLRVTQGERKAELGAVRGDLAKLAGRRKELEARRGRLVKARDAAAGTVLPSGLVHPGNLGREDKRGVTGRLADIDPAIEWKQVMDPAPPSPAAAPKKAP